MATELVSREEEARFVQQANSHVGYIDELISIPRSLNRVSSISDARRKSQCFGEAVSMIEQKNLVRSRYLKASY